MTDEEKKTFVLETLYEELRHYREKEFHTFIFAFPIIAAGFLPDFQKIKALLLLLTFFGGAMIHYIYRNHKRMMRMKESIVAIQDQLAINSYFGVLDPQQWRQRKFNAHLGMITYIVLLASQLVILWKDIIIQAITRASS